MLLNTLVKVGSFAVKATVKTAEVVAPVLGKATDATVMFTRKEVELGKREAAKQSKLIQADYKACKIVLSKTSDDVMDSFTRELAL